VTENRMTNKKNKVMVGIITHKGKDYCFKQLIDFLLKLDKDLVEITFVENSSNNRYYYQIANHKRGYLTRRNFKVSARRGPWKKDVGYRIIANRNKLREVFLKSDCTHLLMLDADIVPHDHEVIEKLLLHNKEVVHAVCPIFKNINEKPVLVSHIYQPGGKLNNFKLSTKFKFVPLKKLPKRKLIRVIGVGLGCCLITRNIANLVKFRKKKGKKGWMVCEDLMFCADIHKLNIPIYVDCGQRCMHYVLGDKNKVKDLKT